MKDYICMKNPTPTTCNFGEHLTIDGLDGAIESNILEQGNVEEVHATTVRIARLFQQFTYWPTYLLLRLLYRYEVEGQENLIGLEERGVIFASNHASILDGPVLAAAMPRGSLFPKDFFPVRFLVSKEFFGFRTNPYIFLVSHITTTYVRINSSIPVIRGLGNPSNNLAEAVSAIRGGAKVSIFPEGKITKDGRLQSGKWGKEVVPKLFEKEEVEWRGFRQTQQYRELANRSGKPVR